MRQDQLDGLVTFLCVAEHSSFSGAAVRLGISPSVVSQTIRGLELRLGTVLFNRSTRSVSLTEVGATYLGRVRPAVDELTAATAELGDASDRPKGLLRLHVPRSGFMIALQPVMRDFLVAYPEVTLEVVIESSLVDIVAGGFDAGMRFGDLVDGDMIGVRVSPTLSAFIVGAPDYLRRRGVPQQPRELLDHDCVCFRHVTTGQIERWSLSKGDEHVELALSGRLIVNDSSALIQAALDGIGLVYTINGYIGRFLDQGRLVRVLADWSPPLAGLTLYYPHRRRVPLKLRAFIDFLRRNLDVATLSTEEAVDATRTGGFAINPSSAP